MWKKKCTNQWLKTRQILFKLNKLRTATNLVTQKDLSEKLAPLDEWVNFHISNEMHIFFVFFFFIVYFERRKMASNLDLKEVLFMVNKCWRYFVSILGKLWKSVRKRLKICILIKLVHNRRLQRSLYLSGDRQTYTRTNTLTNTKFHQSRYLMFPTFWVHDTSAQIRRVCVCVSVCVTLFAFQLANKPNKSHKQLKRTRNSISTWKQYHIIEINWKALFTLSSSLYRVHLRSYGVSQCICP